ncbi:TRAP transporter permease [Phytoactinopolyspora limicola]|uniref:TRAP transporter permease n=1 Tax=Phytoactinopolyspora limicola TaxID=2715536 RepID=UPI00140CD3D1|nr:TRAP transporter permease [Phytoactinopolyspora limicola]
MADEKQAQGNPPATDSRRALDQVPDELPPEIREELKEDVEKLEQIGFTDAALKTRTNLQVWWRWAFFLLALTLSIFHLYTALYGQLPSYQQRTFHLGFGLGLTFLLYPAKTAFSQQQARRSWILTGLVLAGLAFLVANGDAGLHTVLPAVGVVLLVQAARHLPWQLAGMPVADVVLALLSFGALLYLFTSSDEIMRRGAIHPETDIAVGALAVMLVLVAAQRVIGTPLVAVAAVMLAYAFYGDQMPGFLQHSGYSIDRIISTQLLGLEGVFGTPIAVSSTFIFMFMIFAAMLQRTGMERFFTEFAFGATGWMTGGTAKVGVLTSAFSGTITGSSVANTVGNGAFTIPMMKKSGYKGEYAGAVEAASSTGGQIAPPVMGAAAFIMIDITGQPYSEIMKAAIIPAILFFVAQYVIIHYDSKRLRIGGLPRHQLPKVGRLIARKGYLIIPIVVIFLILLDGQTPMRAATYAIGAAVAINLLAQLVALAFRKWRAMEDKLTPMAVLDGLVDAARLALPIIVACAAAGLIAGVITLTGIGLRLANELVSLSGGHLLTTAFLAMIACLILGIGVPTTANYVITATLAAPAIMIAGGFESGTTQILIAHMFVYYFGVLADITPPVCLASYAASGIAQSNPIRTGVQSARIALGGFLVPYMFLLSPELLMQDATWGGIVLAFVTATFGIFCVACAVVGFIDRPINPLIRLALAAAGLLLLHASVVGDLLGLAVGVSIFAWQWWTGPRARRQAAVTTGDR